VHFRSILQAQRALVSEWRWPHFRIEELACKCDGRFCAGSYWHAPTILDRLEILRGKVGKPLVITSGHRCAQWNALIGGAPQSRHKTLAVDLALRGHDRHALLRDAHAAGFAGFGLGRSFLHVDCRAVGAHWFYAGSETLWQT